MIVAAATLWNKGFWAHMGGMEVPFTYGLLALFIAWAGPGAYSLDALLGLNIHGTWIALGGLAVAALGSLPLVLMVERHRKQQS
jgi:putative oxidoreductase